jgi:hypothetical protein
LDNSRRTEHGVFVVVGDTLGESKKTFTDVDSHYVTAHVMMIKIHFSVGKCRVFGKKPSEKCLRNQRMAHNNDWGRFFGAPLLRMMFERLLKLLKKQIFGTCSKNSRPHLLTSPFGSTPSITHT